MERFHEFNAMQFLHEFISLLWLCEESTFTFHSSLASHLFSLISLFSLENPTELVFLIQHMFAVFSDLIGPESSRETSLVLSFRRLPLFQFFACAIRVAHQFRAAITFPYHLIIAGHWCFSILTHHRLIVTNSNVTTHNLSLSRSVGKIVFERAQKCIVRKVSAGRLLRLRLISQETSVIASELGIVSRRRCKRPVHYSQS